MNGMRLLAVHTCPLWESLPDGERRPGVSPADLPETGRLVGWLNVLKVVLAGERRWLVLGPEAHR